MPTPLFPKNDPADVAFWESRYAAAYTPWDQAGIPQLIQEYADKQTMPRCVLVPGCGAAYEARYFCERGWDVLAIDFSLKAVETATALLGHFASIVRLDDFFTLDPREKHYDLVYERAFLCALPRRLRPNWAAHMAKLLQPGGQLVGYFFFDEGERGPPFGLKDGEITALLSKNFTLIEEKIPTDSIPVFAEKEKWQIWQRK